jgi:hypothetical protein
MDAKSERDFIFDVSRPGHNQRFVGGITWNEPNDVHPRRIVVDDELAAMLFVDGLHFPVDGNDIGDGFEVHGPSLTLRSIFHNHIEIAPTELQVGPHAGNIE